MLIRIYGYGVVGQATHSLFGDKVETQIVDPGLDNNIKETWCKPDVIFIACPIVNDPKTHDQTVDNVIKILNEFYKEYDAGTTVCIRSTCTYDNVKKLQEEFKGKFKFVVMPEFLNEVSSFDDVKHSDVLIGGKFDDVLPVINLIDDYTDLTYHVISAKDACDFKYVHNLYGAMKVLFWEMVHDITAGHSRQMYRLYQLFKSGDMATVGMDGFRGAGGKCFPENLETVHNKHEILNALYEYNQKLLKANKS